MIVRDQNAQPESQGPASSADATRMALIRAAMHLFGQEGFEGTSTRRIATMAKANIGSIAYHFGGKEGLRAAVADHIVETVRSVARQALGDLAMPGAPLPPAEARAQLAAVAERMVAFLVAQPEAGQIAQFLLRELSHPSAAIDRVYSGVFEPVHKRLCAVWEQATGEPAESEETRLTVFSMIGQVVYFRIGREPVMRRMGWKEIGPAEAAKVGAIIAGNLEAMLAAHATADPGRAADTENDA
ncbi:CerR family C-terminal domain-containing protein [Mesorhizobium sp. SP-1A]|uniref:CerR family C-terminal domain-containing protein n=1 Tax=Mesorhizobium sp. SP-1A TaxID=3077840 RepID=UPI0028F6E5CA|nr:CerR family C-terminal domain-containing protein [Mesorhizobium sp. SP-1A]